MFRYEPERKRKGTVISVRTMAEVHDVSQTKAMMEFVTRRPHELLRTPTEHQEGPSWLIVWAYWRAWRAETAPNAALADGSDVVEA